MSSRRVPVTSIRTVLITALGTRRNRTAFPIIPKRRLGHLDVCVYRMNEGRRSTRKPLFPPRTSFRRPEARGGCIVGRIDHSKIPSALLAAVAYAFPFRSAPIRIAFSDAGRQDLSIPRRWGSVLDILVFGRSESRRK